ncbi:MAG: type I-E CRISPR-associated protein Cas7/Cse4/CasC [Treponema sp.]|nr:type I-E CRISPR-associated protein Cas7/Cse4/CasC [Treponema sp.]
MMKEKNKYTNKRIEFHILQSFPVTCLNRDDVGVPKTAVVGGVTRARVSSQCWKRAVRMAMQDVGGVQLAKRTKLIGNLIGDACKKLGADDISARKCGLSVESIFSKEARKKFESAQKNGEFLFDESDAPSSDDSEDSKSDTLIFMGQKEIEALAHKFEENAFDYEKVFPLSEKKPEKILEKLIGKAQFALTDELDGLDIALFGRMIAQAPTLDVEAAASFSHAISTHKVTNQIEFFTALDDFSEAQGSAHMGTLEFNAATYYRYITLDLGQLYETMGNNDEFFPQAIEAFIKALFIAVPSARQTSQAGFCTWDYAKVLVREGQGVQLSFETPVKARDGGYLQPSIEEVKNQLAKKEKLSGSLFGKIKEFEFGINEDFSIDHLIEGVKSAVKA